MRFYGDLTAEAHHCRSQVLKCNRKTKHMLINLEQRLKESIFLPLNWRLTSTMGWQLILNHTGSWFKIHGVPINVQLCCQSSLLRALCGATKSGPWLLSTSVLPFPSFRPRPLLVTSCHCQSSVAEFTLGDVTEMCDNDVMLHTRGDKTASHYLHVWHHFKTSYAHKNTQRYGGIIYYMLTCHFSLRFIFIWPDTYRGTVLTQF